MVMWCLHSSAFIHLPSSIKAGIILSLLYWQGLPHSKVVWQDQGHYLRLVWRLLGNVYLCFSIVLMLKSRSGCAQLSSVSSSDGCSCMALLPSLCTSQLFIVMVELQGLEDVFTYREV